MEDGNYDDYEEFNPNFYCPITDQLMVDPVIDRDGNSYERKAIEEWLGRCATSPITRNPLQISDLTPNRTLKSAIERDLAKGKKHRRSGLGANQMSSMSDVDKLSNLFQSWDRPTLVEIFQLNDGNFDRTVECILSMSTNAIDIVPENTGDEMISTADKEALDHLSNIFESWDPQDLMQQFQYNNRNLESTIDCIFTLENGGDMYPPEPPESIKQDERSRATTIQVRCESCIKVVYKRDSGFWCPDSTCDYRDHFGDSKIGKKRIYACDNCVGGNEDRGSKCCNWGICETCYGNIQNKLYCYTPPEQYMLEQEENILRALTDTVSAARLSEVRNKLAIVRNENMLKMAKCRKANADAKQSQMNLASLDEEKCPISLCPSFSVLCPKNAADSRQLLNCLFCDDKIEILSFDDETEGNEYRQIACIHCSEHEYTVCFECFENHQNVAWFQRNIRAYWNCRCPGTETAYHRMRFSPRSFICNLCFGDEEGSSHLFCRECEFDVCNSCVDKYGHSREKFDSAAKKVVCRYHPASHITSTIMSGDRLECCMEKPDSPGCRYGHRKIHQGVFERQGKHRKIEIKFEIMTMTPSLSHESDKSAKKWSCCNSTDRSSDGCAYVKLSV